jgi:hypothetical protein
MLLSMIIRGGIVLITINLGDKSSTLEVYIIKN